ncbi:MAG: hypothetical protein K8T89_06770 [Planctomycetes bacterium]|nr:hypothetical protein [Planctomycetota bacterium]
MRLLGFLILMIGLMSSSGCGKTQPKFSIPTLYTVKGVLVLKGVPVTTGGEIQAYLQPDDLGMVIKGIVGSDGRFELTTRLATDPEGKTQPGAPEGLYNLVYRAENAEPVDIPSNFQPVRADIFNEWYIELPK